MIVTVTAAAAAVLVAVNVTVLVPVVETGEKAALTPVGNPVALKATLPVNPPVGVTVIVLVAVPPCPTETLAGLAASEKSACPGTVSVTVAVCTSVPLVPVMVSVDVPVAAVG